MRISRGKGGKGVEGSHYDVQQLSLDDYRIITFAKNAYIIILHVCVS